MRNDGIGSVRQASVKIEIADKQEYREYEERNEGNKPRLNPYLDIQIMRMSSPLDAGQRDFRIYLIPGILAAASP